jgi:hypothetical protein
MGEYYFLFLCVCGGVLVGGGGVREIGKGHKLAIWCNFLSTRKFQFVSNIKIMKNI